MRTKTVKVSGTLISSTRIGSHFQFGHVKSNTTVGNILAAQEP